VRQATASRWPWESWAALRANHDQLKAWLFDGGLTSVKATELLCRKAVAVPERTVQRYALKVLGVGRSARSSLKDSDLVPQMGSLSNLSRVQRNVLGL
jgi:hypothetical protein